MKKLILGIILGYTISMILQATSTEAKIRHLPKPTCITPSPTIIPTLNNEELKIFYKGKY